MSSSDSKAIAGGCLALFGALALWLGIIATVVYIVANIVAGAFA